MGVRIPEAAEPASVQVTARWRENSLRSVWLRPGDWWHPTVDQVAEKIIHGDGVLDAVEALGAARAGQGVGVGEAIDDLGALYRALGDGPPPLEVVRALCEGWASPAGQPFSPMTARDPESGLPTLDYFAVRLAEEYEVVRSRGGNPSTDLRLVLVDVARGSLSPWDRMARSAALGQAVDGVFGPSWPAASLGGGMFVVLHRDPAALDADVMRLREEITTQGHALGVTNLMRQPPRVWVEALQLEHQATIESLAAWRR